MTEHRFALVPAAYVVLLRTEKSRRQVLLQRRHNTGFFDDYWSCGAAGHVEPGESASAAAQREASEELGITVDERELVPFTVVHRTMAPSTAIEQRVDFYFQAHRWHGTPEVMEPSKSAGLGWFSIDELPSDTVPHELAVLAKLRESAVPPVLFFGF